MVDRHDGAAQAGGGSAPWPSQFSWRVFLAVAGPGLVAMLADTDAGSVITVAQSGAQWGYRLLLSNLLFIPFMFFAQELALRVGPLSAGRAATTGSTPQTIAAIGDGFGHSGLVILDGTVRGGTQASDTTDAGSVIQAPTSTVGTLDGTAGAVTVAAGAHVLIGWGETLTAKGTMANHGTVSIVANAAAPGASIYNVPALQVAGALVLDSGAVTTGGNNTSSLFAGVISGSGSLTTVSQKSSIDLTTSMKRLKSTGLVI